MKYLAWIVTIGALFQSVAVFAEMPPAAGAGIGSFTGPTASGAGTGSITGPTLPPRQFCLPDLIYNGLQDEGYLMVSSNPEQLPLKIFAGSPMLSATYIKAKKFDTGTVTVSYECHSTVNGPGVLDVMALTRDSAKTEIDDDDTNLFRVTSLLKKWVGFRYDPIFHKTELANSRSIKTVDTVNITLLANKELGLKRAQQCTDLDGEDREATHKIFSAAKDGLEYSKKFIEEWEDTGEAWVEQYTERAKVPKVELLINFDSMAKVGEAVFSGSLTDQNTLPPVDIELVITKGENGTYKLEGRKLDNKGARELLSQEEAKDRLKKVKDQIIPLMDCAGADQKNKGREAAFLISSHALGN